MAEAGKRVPGEVLDGRYRLVRRLGRGGFGDVWRAEELLPDATPLREVALKLLRGSGGQDWSAEARIIASLRHPALVTIYAAGILAVPQGQIPFVAMELLLGENLNAFVARKERMPWRRVLDWARQAAAALDEIHRAGVVHLDLKPANLFLPEDGGLKVLDFGIARHGIDQPVPTPIPGDGEGLDEMSTAAFMVQVSSENTPEGAPTSRGVVGTPGFMAPEVFEEGEPSASSDAYALAACVVLLVTGSLPQRVGPRPKDERSESSGTVANTTAQAWLSQLQSATVRGAIRALAEEHPDLPLGLAELLQRWLALDPEARGVSKGTMRAQLDEVWERPFGLPDNPYRGLEVYRPEDEGSFYGRATDAARLARELEDAPAAILHGERGIGLQSLARAGVLPRLAQSFADGRHDWRSCDLTFEDPTLSLDEHVSEALQRFLGDHPGNGRGDEVSRLLRWAETSPVGALVVIDDLHRVVTDDGASPELLPELVERLLEGPSGLRLVATVAAEHTGQLLEHPVGTAMRPWLRFIGPIGAGAVDALVRGPAEAARRPLDEADAIIDAVSAELDDGSRLPLVSLALRRWWEACGEGALRREVWDELGGVVGVAASHAEEVFRDLDEATQAHVEALLLRLVSVDGEPVTLPVEMLHETERTLVEPLRRRRLLNCRRGEVSLVHPELAERWTRLHALRLAHTDRLTFVQDLRAASHRWVMAGKPRRLLWGGAALERVATWREVVEVELGDDERDFVRASEVAWRWVWVRRIALGLAAVAAVVLGVWFDGEQKRRQTAQEAALERAQLEGAREGMVSLARAAEDPYAEVSLLAGAVAAGDLDPLTRFELVAAAQKLPQARFLTLDEVPRPDFHWGERWLIGGGREVVVFDFKPPAGPEFAPSRVRFRPHDDGMADFVPVPFDHAFVSRGLDGHLKVWRLRDDGSVGLAASSPFRCVRGLSQVLVAARAPVVSCTTDEGVVRWDLRSPSTYKADPFAGRVLDISADGQWVAAAWLRKLLLWKGTTERRLELDVEVQPSVARFSPRDQLVALVRPSRLEVLDLAGKEPKTIHEQLVVTPNPVDARWDEGGVDVAVCDFTGTGDWYYLRGGGRDPEDPVPPPTARPCVRERGRWPEKLYHPRDYGPRLSQRHLGPRRFEGGYRFEDGRVLTRDLVMFPPGPGSLAPLISYGGGALDDEAERAQGSSITAAVVLGDEVVWQVGEEIRILDREGEPILRRAGKLLRHCPNGSLLAYRKANQGAIWEFFDARRALVLKRVSRAPGFVLGADGACKVVLFQNLEGGLATVTLDQAGPDPAPLDVGRAVDGYVYDVRWSGEGAEGGLWLAVSDGTMWHWGRDGFTPYGRATPRATAMADGQAPGILIFADEAGVHRRRGEEPATLLFPARGDRVYEDLHAVDAQMVVLSWAHGVALLDTERHELAGTLDLEMGGRLSPWDADGSLLVWPYAFMGGPRGNILPLGGPLAVEIGAQTSNLRAKLGDEKQIELRLEGMP